MLDPRIAAGARAMEELVKRKPTVSSLDVSAAIIAAADALITSKASFHAGRYMIELPLTIGQAWRIMEVVEPAEDIAEAAIALSDGIRAVAEMIEQLPEPEGDGI
ncbi:hypothetical protein LDL36_20275 [Komagataeibacter sp. FNDCR1]|nr:hypothetical protein [Komagataeibacter sp. FNDCR1]